ncbi:MAG: DNA-directed RNA polymerase subunit delta [Candidatus Izemoplasma sp.]|nr:DNA-directed RNA polymerase subunit delta [Candidatus Izemoplasma sp.]
MQSELSLVGAAIKVLKKEKTPLNVYDLYKKAVDLADAKAQETDDTINNFYADLVTSAHFIYVGDNEWDLKENQKIELWDKDGSHYKEYTKVEVPKETAEKPKKEAKKSKPKSAEKEVVEEEVIDPKQVEPAETVIDEEDKVVPEVDVVADENLDDEGVVEDYEEDVFEEDYDDDFDEEKYNEYMDKYEDRYDD